MEKSNKKQTLKFEDTRGNVTDHYGIEIEPGKNKSQDVKISQTGTDIEGDFQEINNPDYVGINLSKDDLILLQIRLLEEA